MNCEEYREAIAADPSFDGGAGHLSECAACQAYRKEMLELDKAIGKALALDVPKLEMPELPDIEADNVVSLPQRRLQTGTSAVRSERWASCSHFCFVRPFSPHRHNSPLAGSPSTSSS